MAVTAGNVNVKGTNTSTKDTMMNQGINSGLCVKLLNEPMKNPLSVSPSKKMEDRTG